MTEDELRVDCRHIVTTCRECKTREECVDFGLQGGCAALQATGDLLFEVLKKQYNEELSNEFEL